MLESQKLSLRLSKLRQELADLPDDAADADADALTDAYTKCETEYRRALVMEAEDLRQAEERGEAPDPPESADREFSELVRSASIRDFLTEAVTGNPITGGAALELRQAVMGEAAAEGRLPLAMLTSPYGPEGQPLEFRLGADAVTSIAAAPGTQQRPIAAQVFARSDGAYLGVDYPTVAIGAAAFPAITTGATAGPSGDGDARAATAGVIAVRQIEPTRIDGAFLMNNRDRHTVVGIEDSLRVNLVEALGDSFDDQILNGNGVDPNFAGFFQSLTDPTAPTVTATGATFLSTTAGGVDGKLAYVVDDVRLLVGVQTYQLAASLPVHNAGPLLIDRLGPGQLRASSRIAAPVSNDQQAILYKAGAVGRAVAPIWEGVEIIRDNVTSADRGQTRLTAAMYAGFMLTRSDGHAQVAFQLG